MYSVIRMLKLQQKAGHHQAKEAKIIDIALPGDARINDIELEKIEKYHRRNRKVVEAEESDGSANCDWGINSYIRFV